MLCLLTGCASQMKKTQQIIDNSTISELDIQRYMGIWYEIARFPHSFEKDMVGVTATYTLKDDGKIEVINQGRKRSLDGKIKRAKGKAKIPDKSEPGKLKVSFFLFFYGDYYVLELDQENYQWVMIGSSSDKYFWILCRSPEMDPQIYRELLERAKQRGYDTSKLIQVVQ